MQPPTAVRNNLNAISEAFGDLRDSASPFSHLLQSSSFIEGNKLAIPQLVADIFKKPWSEMHGNERLAYIGKNCVSMAARRFDYLVLLCRSSLDFVVATIKAIFSSLLKFIMTSQDPVKHWRHMGVALFTICNSCFGLLTPKYANLSQLFFSAAVLGIAGRNLKDKINNLIQEVRNRWQQAQPQQLPPA